MFGSINSMIQLKQVQRILIYQGKCIYGKTVDTDRKIEDEGHSSHQWLVVSGNSLNIWGVRKRMTCL